MYFNCETCQCFLGSLLSYCIHAFTTICARMRDVTVTTRGASPIALEFRRAADVTRLIDRFRSHWNDAGSLWFLFKPQFNIHGEFKFKMDASWESKRSVVEWPVWRRRPLASTPHITSASWLLTSLAHVSDGAWILESRNQMFPFSNRSVKIH